MEVLRAAARGDVPIRVTVRRAIDIRTAFRIADEYGLRMILDECTEGYKVAELIAEKKAPVVLGPYYYYPRTASEYREGEEVNWNNAGSTFTTSSAFLIPSSVLAPREFQLGVRFQF